MVKNVLFGLLFAALAFGLPPVMMIVLWLSAVNGLAKRLHQHEGAESHAVR